MSRLDSEPTQFPDTTLKSAMKFGVPQLGLAILRRWIRNKKEHGAL